MGYLRKDLRFLDEAISLSNTAKKRNLLEPANNLQKIPKKVKNLRYFLRKKRNINFKSCP
jgi:hypothetical protein